MSTRTKAHARVETRLMTVEEVSYLLSISKSLVYRMAKSGELPTVRMGNHRLLRFRREDIEKAFPLTNGWYAAA